jgi:hypothetical protein
MELPAVFGVMKTNVVYSGAFGERTQGETRASTSYMKWMIEVFRGHGRLGAAPAPRQQRAAHRQRATCG